MRKNSKAMIGLGLLASLSMNNNKEKKNRNDEFYWEYHFEPEMLKDGHLETSNNIYYAGINNNFIQSTRLFKFYLKKEVKSGTSIKYFYNVVSCLKPVDKADNRNANNLQDLRIYSAMISRPGFFVLQDIDDTSTYDGNFYKYVDSDDIKIKIEMVGTKSKARKQNESVDVSRAYIADVTGHIEKDFEFPKFEEVYQKYIDTINEKRKTN